MNQDNFNGKSAENQGIIAMTAQKRIAEAVKFFDFLYDRVPTPTFIYLAKFKDKREFPAFSATDAKQRAAMAVKAIELSDSSVDIWHSVNPVSVKPSGGKRGDESAVAYQVAIVTDIDIRSDAHKSENLAADFDEAKSFLPFAPTILIHSGYGIQAYYIFDTPIKISDENREECKRRNELFLDVIRARANGKTIDAVGDLPRILRTPGTFNYKLGKDNAPLCHIVDFSDVRFTPAEIDEKLAALPIPATPSKPVDVDKSARNHREIIDDSDFDIYRARRMLDFINPASLSYEDWFAVGAALKNVGCSCSDWQIWSKADDRFKDGECEYKWDTFDRDGYGIGTLYNFAVQAGYDAKEIYREYADTHPDFARKRAIRADFHSSPAPMDADDIEEITGSGGNAEDIIFDIRENLLQWKVNKKGERLYILPTYDNARIIFNNDPNLKNLIGYDEFQDATVMLKKACWQKGTRIDSEWSDKDDAQLRLYLRKNYADFQAKQLVEDMVVEISQANAFNPVKDYFANLPQWDGVERVGKFFINYLRVDDTPYAREVTWNWFIGAIARIFHVGCRYQTALVLHGAQGVGKSYSIERLGGKWYLELTDNVDDSHAADAIKKGWLVEIKEMSAMRRAEINAVKAFIERGQETRRAAYDKRATTVYRHCVFAITVNDSEFLRDQTGNRRYMILHCGSKARDYIEEVDGESLSDDNVIDQIWAEAYARYNEMFANGFNEQKLLLSRDTARQADEFATQYLQDDGMAGEVKAFLDKKILPQYIWQLLTREERREFFAKGRLTLLDGLADLNKRRRANGGKEDIVQHDVNLISNFLDGVAGKNFVRRNEIKRGDDAVEEFIVYGSEYRQHICAGEIFNECFGSDKRKSMYRIGEILEQLDGWHLGARLRNADNVYFDQRKPYYRDTETIPDETRNEDQEERDDYYNELIDPTDTPF